MLVKLFFLMKNFSNLFSDIFAPSIAKKRVVLESPVSDKVEMQAFSSEKAPATVLIQKVISSINVGMKKSYAAMAIARIEGMSVHVASKVASFGVATTLAATVKKLREIVSVQLN